MYKAAKEAGDAKNLDKYRKIALDLTKKKKDLELQMDKALGGLYQDAELELKEGKLNEKGNNMYDDVLALKRSFGIFKQQSPDLYRDLDRKFKIKNIEKTLEDMIKFMDTPAAMREGELNEAPMSKQFARDWVKDHEALKRHIKHEMNKPEARKMGLIGGPGGLEDMMKRVMASQAIPDMLGQKISAMTNNQQGFVD
jgi:hypothetical protein